MNRDNDRQTSIILAVLGILPIVWLGLLIAPSVKGGLPEILPSLMNVMSDPFHNINYPVMQSVNEPNFYLKHGFDKEYSDYGCPYVQEDCDVQEPSDNLVIYGHHMSNGSMFAHLEKFKSKDFWSEHRMITFNTLTDKQEYEIIAVFRTVVYTDSPEAFKFYRFIDAESANNFVSFVAKCKELSFYDTGVTAEYGDKLITLSTCEYSRNNSRLVVVAKRITEDGGADAAKTHAEATAEGERPN